MGKTKIDWADMTSNNVWGCLQNPPCPYCYARKIARRFGKTPDQKSFVPTWMHGNYSKEFPDKPLFIFVNSMSDIAYWKDTWIELTLKIITEYPQHTYFFLTKNPECYVNFLQFPSNCWFGVSITDQGAMDRFDDLFFTETWPSPPRKFFYSIEPMLTQIELAIYPDWLIIGAETGNRKSRVIPNPHWGDKILDICDLMDIPIWMKDNLKGIWPGDLIQDKPEVRV